MKRAILFALLLTGCTTDFSCKCGDGAGWSLVTDKTPDSSLVQGCYDFCRTHWNRRLPSKGD